MKALELRHKLINIIHSSDEHFLQMVNDLYVNYKENRQDFFTNLPVEIQELLLESKNQVKEGKTRSHEEVMDSFRKKYALPK